MTTPPRSCHVDCLTGTGNNNPVSQLRHSRQPIGASEERFDLP
jgi:hypothetical protein